jgi:exodeoxyribonuclease-3
MLTTPGIAERTVAASVYREQRFSDHAPLIIDFDTPFSA